MFTGVYQDKLTKTKEVKTKRQERKVSRRSPTYKKTRITEEVLVVNLKLF